MDNAQSLWMEYISVFKKELKRSFLIGFPVELIFAGLILLGGFFLNVERGSYEIVFALIGIMALIIFCSYVFAILPYIEYSGGWGRKMLHREIEINGTTRVINVMKALENARYNGKGKVSIGINDPFCKENCGVFTVHFDGQAESVVVGDNSPDIEMSIGAFSSLILGRGNLQYALRFEGTVIHGNVTDLEKVFYKKSVCYSVIVE